MNISDARLLLPVELPCSQCPWESGLARAVACANLRLFELRASVAIVTYQWLLFSITARLNMNWIWALGYKPGSWASRALLKVWIASSSCLEVSLYSSKESHSWALHFSTRFLPESSNQPYSCSCSTRAERIFPDACELLRAHQQALKFFLRPENMYELHLFTGWKTEITHGWESTILSSRILCIPRASFFLGLEKASSLLTSLA